MRIRQASPEDAESISDLLIRLAEKYIVHDFSAEGREILLESLQPAQIRRNLDEDYRYHVAEQGRRIVAVIGFRGDRHLYHLFVAEPYHRQGIATSMWKVAVDQFLKDAEDREITVNASRYARPFYERLGFIAQSGPEDQDGVITIPMKWTREPK